MVVYRICLEKWASKLQSSGRAARWNSEGMHVIYTSGTRALACLENLVHRSGEGLDSLFCVMVIEIDADISISAILEDQLPYGWTQPKHYLRCRKMGDQWISDGKSCVLKVPSAIIPEEFNYLINPSHREIKKVRLLRTEPFCFDTRFK